MKELVPTAGVLGMKADPVTARLIAGRVKEKEDECHE